MSNRFEWQTRDDEPWSVLGDDRSQAAAPVRRPGRFVLLVLLLLALAAFAVLRALDLRVSETRSRVSHDVRSALQFLLRVQSQQDSELFVAALSGRDPAWTATQQDLLRNGLLFDRPAFGLRWLAPENPPSEAFVRLDDELTAAEVGVDFLYETVDRNGHRQTVALRQTLVFRLGQDQRWLYAPPLEAFWGDTIRQRRGALETTFPARDRQLIERLLVDLESDLDYFCTETPGVCPSGRAVALEFSPNPATLLAVAGRERLWRPGFSLRLPTPTLVGLPADDAAYRAFSLGYSHLLLASVMSAGAETACCDHPLFVQAVIDYQLARLELIDWPLEGADYHRLLLDLELASNGFRYWHSRADPERTGPDWRPVYALVEFVAGGRPGNELLPSLTSATSFDSWLNRAIAGTGGDPLSLNRRWQAFLAGRLQDAHHTSPAPWPVADLMVACQPAGSRTVLLTYDPGEKTLTESAHFPGVLSITATPDQSGLIFESHFSAAPNSFGAVTLRLPGDVDIRVPNIDPQADWFSYLGMSDPAGRRLLFFHDSRQSGGVGSFSLLDLERCTGEACTPIPVVGPLYWSPKGTRALLRAWDDPAGNRIGLASGDGAILQASLPIVARTVPGWLDEGSIAYVTVDGSAIRGYDTVTGQHEVLVTREALATALALPPATAGSLHFRQVLANPNRPGDLYLTFHDRREPEGRQKAARYRLPTAQADQLFQSDGGGLFLSLTRDGRWLVGTDPDSRVSGIQGRHHLVSLDTNRRLSIAFRSGGPRLSGYAPGGEWLAMVEGDYLRLIALDHDYQQIVAVPGLRDCVTAFWVRAS